MYMGRYCNFFLFQSSLETKEYVVNELPNLLEVPQDRLCLAAALLGGTILSEQSLTDFYKRIGINQKKVILYNNLLDKESKISKKYQLYLTFNCMLVTKYSCILNIACKTSKYLPLLGQERLCYCSPNLPNRYIKILQ